MPVRLRFPLRGPVPRTPHIHAAGVYRVVLDWLESGLAGISKPVHKANQVKPLSISPISSGSESYFFEVSLVTDYLLDSLYTGVPESSVISLGDQPYQIGAMQISEEASWEELMSGSPKIEWEFDVVSPTAHRLAGPVRRTVVLPEPALYFGSWLSRWNLCCDRPMNASLLELVRTGVAISDCFGATQTVSLPRGRSAGSANMSTSFKGFVGSVRFRAIPAARLSRDALRELTALARFSTYCGTGLYTMRGMGWTICEPMAPFTRRLEL